MLALPFSTDQFDGAAAIEAAGLGLAADPNCVTPSEVAEAVRSIIGTAHPALDRLSAELALRPGAGIARAAVGEWLGRVATVGTPRAGARRLNGRDDECRLVPPRPASARPPRADRCAGRRRPDRPPVRDRRAAPGRTLPLGQSPVVHARERLRAGDGARGPRGTAVRRARRSGGGRAGVRGSGRRGARRRQPRLHAVRPRARRPGRGGTRSARHRVGHAPGPAHPRAGGRRHSERPAVPPVRAVPASLARATRTRHPGGARCDRGCRHGPRS